jgi:hypothetical protein
LLDPPPWRATRRLGLPARFNTSPLTARPIARRRVEAEARRVEAEARRVEAELAAARIRELEAELARL